MKLFFFYLITSYISLVGGSSLQSKTISLTLVDILNHSLDEMQKYIHTLNRNVNMKTFPNVLFNIMINYFNLLSIL